MGQATWIKAGLQTIDERRPTLVLGRELARFLCERRQRTRQRCEPGQLYCVRCRAPKAPVAGVTDYMPITASSGNLRGRCGDCGTVMWRRVLLLKLNLVAGDLEVSFAQAQPRIRVSASTCLNGDFDEVS